MSQPLGRRASLAAAACLAVGAPGCGSGPPASGPVAITVTRDFGSRAVARATAPVPGDGESALALVRRHLPGSRPRRDGSGPVAGVPAGRGARWRLYVNGLAARAGDPRARPGDRLWWDLHGAAIGPRAVVGSFPQPFRSGLRGRRLPVVVVCSPGAREACAEATRRLRAVGVTASLAAPGAAAGAATLRLLVGPWAEVRRDAAGLLVARGPAASGVGARFGAGGRALTPLRPDGRPAGPALGPGTGLVAATAPAGQTSTWLVTGTDRAGVLAAARALRRGALANRFAVAVRPGAVIALPRARPGR